MFATIVGFDFGSRTAQTSADSAAARAQGTVTEPAPARPAGVPAVTGVEPGRGPAAGGTSATVTGTGFTEGAVVFFGPNPATAVTRDSETQLSITAPAGTPGEVDVQVKTSAGTSATSAAAKYTYEEAAPVVAAVPVSSPGEVQRRAVPR